MKALLKKIDDFLTQSLRKRIELFNRVQRSIQLALEMREEARGETYINIMVYGITEIQVVEVKKVIHVTITTTRPGTVIGEGGECSNYIRDFVSRMEDDKPVKIHVVESRLWRSFRYGKGVTFSDYFSYNKD